MVRDTIINEPYQALRHPFLLGSPKACKHCKIKSRSISPWSRREPDELAGLVAEARE